MQKPLSFMEEIVYCKIAVQATMYCMGDMEYNASLPSLKVQNLVSQVHEENVHEWLMSSMVWMWAPYQEDAKLQTGTVCEKYLYVCVLFISSFLKESEKALPFRSAS